MLTLEFIAGFVSAQGSFIEYMRGGHPYHAVQIKTSIDNASLLDQIASTLDLHNRVYKYSHGEQGYSLLIVRDRESILKTIVPALEGRLVGTKVNLFNDWKRAIFENSSMWSYRNIKISPNTDSYQIVDKKPNSRTKQSG